MTHQINQSGKIEQTNRDTVIAFSNGKPGWIRLSAHQLRFGLVGRGSKAQGVAYQALEAKRADFSVRKEEVLALVCCNMRSETTKKTRYPVNT